MPDPDPKTISLNLTSEKAILVLFALNYALKNPQNTRHYRLKIDALAKHLCRLIIDAWPVFADGPITDLVGRDIYHNKIAK